MYFKYFKLSTYNQHHFPALKPGKKTTLFRHSLRHENIQAAEQNETK